MLINSASTIVLNEYARMQCRLPMRRIRLFGDKLGDHGAR